MLKWNSRHMTSFAKETVEYLLWIFHKQLSLHLARLQRPTRWTVVLLLIRIDPWLVTCDDLINVFWSTAILFCQHCFAPIVTSLFLRDCQIVRDPTRKNLLYGQLFMQYRKFWWKKCPRLALSHGINFLWHNGRFRRSFTNFVFERTSATIELIKPVFHSAKGWCFIAI